MSRAAELKRMREQYAKKRALQEQQVTTVVETCQSPIEVAERAALKSQLKGALALKTIMNTALLSTVASQYSQHAPEVAEELKEIVKVYAQQGIRELENDEW